MKKIVFGVILLAGLIALAQAFPGVSRDSAESTEINDNGKKDGVVIILPPRGSIFDDSEDDDDDEASDVPSLWHPFRFNKNSFQDIFSRMQETMNRIRAEMAAALAAQLGQGGLTPWGKIPEGANTTSTTKIIGDHAVTINETTYTDGDENSGTIFRVRVVDVKPLNDTTLTINNNDGNAATAGNNESSASDEDGGEEKQQPATTPANKRESPTNNDNDDKREELTTRNTETFEEFDNEINNNKNQIEPLTA